jgi:hypothetical protein
LAHARLALARRLAVFHSATAKTAVAIFEQVALYATEDRVGSVDSEQVQFDLARDRLTGDLIRHLLTTRSFMSR